MKRQFSAGGVVFKRENGKVWWLVVQPRPGDHYHQGIRWQLPKGWVDEGESLKETAVREVAEEAEVKAKIIEKVDSIRFFFFDENKEKVMKTVTFFLMEYQGETGKGVDKLEVARTAWLPFEEAYKLLTFETEKEILVKAREIAGFVTL